MLVFSPCPVVLSIIISDERSLRRRTIPLLDIRPTGGRMVLSTLRELTKRGGKHALLTVCAAGGLGAAVVLESV